MNDMIKLSEVSKLLGVTDEALKKHIRNMWPDKMVNGKPTYLDQSEITEIKAKMIPTTQVVAVSTDFEMMQKANDVLSWMKSKMIELEDQNKKLLPKAAFYDQVTESEDTIDIGTASKVLNYDNIGRNKLFSILRSAKVLDKNNNPYQRYVDAEYFRCIESKFTKPDGSTCINIKTVVYQKGLDFIRKIMDKYIDGGMK